jgi:gamma-glutamyltranspeptidase/glutathione hydrolase
LHGVLDRGLTLDAALAAPRFHHQWSPNELRIEKAWPADVMEKLKALGHVLAPVSVGGASNGVGFFDGQFVGASEPRVPGEALAW